MVDLPAMIRRLRVLPLLPLLMSFIVMLPVAGNLYPQEYDLLGSVELSSTTHHLKESPVVSGTGLRQDAWETAGTMRIEATHRLTYSGAEFVLDHGLDISPAITSDQTIFDITSDAGSAGTGDTGAGTVTLVHSLNQGYLSLFPAEWLVVRMGRQRMNWGRAYTFSVTDAMHPHHPDAQIETGFDGLSLALRPTPDISLEVAGAIQNAVDTGEMEDVRLGAYGLFFLAPVELGATVVYQYRTILRPGFVTTFPVGPLLVVGEGAMEMYDPRNERMDYQPQFSIGGEYTWYGEVTDISLTAEYLYNGLAEHVPEILLGSQPVEDLSVTTDFAGGFARPGYRYLSGSVSMHVTDSWSTTHTALTNISDESWWVTHGVTLLRVPGVDLGAQVTWNSGDPGTEFGNLSRDVVVELTAKAHF